MIWVHCKKLGHANEKCIWNPNNFRNKLNNKKVVLAIMDNHSNYTQIGTFWHWKLCLPNLMMMVENLCQHMLINSTTWQRPNIVLMRGNVFLLVGHHFYFIFMVAHSFVIGHQPLKFLMESNQFIRKLAKWALLLCEYDFDVVHKVGRINQDADGLNQNPNSS